MAIRETIQIGHPALKRLNQEIVDFSAPELAQLILDLQDTMRATGLIGIASPQIGENFRVFVTEPRETDTRPADQADEFRVYVNPGIVFKSEEKVVIWEGCGSVLNAKLFGPVERPKVVEVEARDAKGGKFRFKADGILGRVIQHEQDHLDRSEFTEHVLDYRDLKVVEFYIKDEKNKPEHLEAQRITIKEFRKVE
ncbi:peptide deformylase [Candidatus Collierbacteria bacterium]|nr:peptide deformylase [Candidatus Collierbacteria bacterium]